MIGQVRASNTNELLLDLLATAVARAPTVLVLEDAQWLDSASWALTSMVHRRVQPLLLILCCRPLAEPIPADYRQLLKTPDLRRLRLDALPRGDVLALVCQRLTVPALPDAVARLVLEKAQGNPFFSEELAYALRDAGLIIVEGDQCRMAPGADLNSAAFPDTVQGVITSRLDRLPPTQQLALIDRLCDLLQPFYYGRAGYTERKKLPKSFGSRGSGAWIRTKDRSIMSRLLCH